MTSQTLPSDIRHGSPASRHGARRQCLLRACEAEGAHLTSVPFGELDFGETAVLDAFYDAGEAGPPSLPPHSSQLSLALAPP